jgi:membrane fusion protein
MQDALFRKEVLEAKGQTWLGNVRLATPISQTVGVALTLTIAFAILLWLSLGHYTRREHVTGILVPQAGLINVTTRSSGIVARVLTNEGLGVVKNAALLVLSGDRNSEAQGNASAKVIDSLRRQRERLRIDIADAQRLSDEQAAGFRMQRDLLRSQLVQVDAQLSLQVKEVRNELALLDKVRPLLDKGYISALQVQQQQTQEVDADVQLKNLTRQRYDIAEQLDNAIRQLQQLPLNTSEKLNDFNRQLEQVEQSILQNEAERSAVLLAPEDGTVSSLLVKPGQAVSEGQSLLAIVPKGSPLQAQLLVPSNAIGFVHLGAQVLLHYQAFPYQKFGVHHGIVVGISNSALTSSEAAALLGESQQNSEAMYRIQVAIPDQRVRAYDKQEPLKAGMAVDADLLLDRRRLVEWIFEPLFGMGRRVGAEK